MVKARFIPRLDVKGPNVVKGIQMEGLRVIGNPRELALKYFAQGADELLYVDVVASLYERNSLTEIIEDTASSGILIPITVGGGVRSLEDIKQILRAGADKVAINTAATRTPEIIRQAAITFGSQCIVGSIEAKKTGPGIWEAYVDNGRECTGLEVVSWAKRLEELGVGEILITSVDREGTRSGYDLELVERIAEAVSVPVIACGGARDAEDIARCIETTRCDGVAFGSLLHYEGATIAEIKHAASSKGANVRLVPESSESRPRDLDSENSFRENKSVSIVDYGVGNMRSVATAFKSAGAEVTLVSKAQDVKQAERLVLPGDGAFGYAMQELVRCGLSEAIVEYAASAKPLLGICLGMQLLMSSSEEFGHHSGLNIIEGEVKAFPKPQDIETTSERIPHIGWSEFKEPVLASWAGTVLDSLTSSVDAYFIHSFCVVPVSRENILATTDYAGRRFCSVVKKGNVYGTQFHPEKSGLPGMRIIENFCRL